MKEKIIISILGFLCWLVGYYTGIVIEKIAQKRGGKN